MRLPIAEERVPYFPRPEGSSSKLKTIRDGISIVKTVFVLVKEERPLEFFFIVGVLFELTALVLFWPVLIEYLETGLVPRLPSAVLSTGLALLGFLGLVCGLILDTVTLGRRETKRLHYLALKGMPVRHAQGPAATGTEHEESATRAPPSANR